MSINSPYGDYAHLKFPSEDVEHVVPSHLLAKMPLIQRLMETSADQDNLIIKEVAASVFEDLLHFLSGNPIELDASRLTSMIDAADVLEIKGAEKALTRLFWNQQERKQEELLGES